MRSSHALSFERGAPRPVAPGVLRLRTPDGGSKCKVESALKTAQGRRLAKVACALTVLVRRPEAQGLGYSAGRVA